MITFPIDYAYKGFNTLQPYLDSPLVCGGIQRIGTLIEYKLR